MSGLPLSLAHCVSFHRAPAGSPHPLEGTRFASIFGSYRETSCALTYGIFEHVCSDFSGINAQEGQQRVLGKHMLAFQEDVKIVF